MTVKKKHAGRVFTAKAKLAKNLIVKEKKTC